jgi:hypothetical protein
MKTKHNIPKTMEYSKVDNKREMHNHAYAERERAT